MIRFLALTTVILGFLGNGAWAQDDSQDGFTNPEFQAFLEGDFAERLRRETLQRSMALQQPECVETPEFEVTDTWPVSPIVMTEGALAPTSGMWRERLTSTACEETVTENMVHTFTAEGQRTFLLVRGRTEADLNTQLTLINDARDVAAADDNAYGCDIIRFTNTSVSNRYGDGRWLERWNVNACGTRVRLDILFDSDAGSETTYSISVVNE